MKIWISRIKQVPKSRAFRVTILVALCFFVTSAIYLSWVYRLASLAGGVWPEWLSLVLGYICQAAGLFLIYHAQRRNPQFNRQHWFYAALTAFAVFSVPARLSAGLSGTAVFGLLMNAACGLLAGLYLDSLAGAEVSSRSSLLFGCGYAAGTFCVFLLMLPGKGSWLHSPEILLTCFLLCLCLARISPRAGWFEPDEEPPDLPKCSPVRENILLSAFVTVFLASLVKNLGFGFPSSQLVSGTIWNPALSRLIYAAGLIAAGCISSRSRKHALICTGAALVIPFIMLDLALESVPELMLWGLDYFFYSFFTVTRVILFLDLSQKTGRREQAGLGLLAGRLGDAAGTALCLILGGHRLSLLAVTCILFFISLFLLFHLSQQLYGPNIIETKSEQEIFEAFCLHHDISNRERDILPMLIGGRTNAEIAESLFISENTVKFHVRNILQKTGCSNRIELQKQYKLSLYPYAALLDQDRRIVQADRIKKAR